MLEDLVELPKTLSMSWPSPQDYSEALQNPALSFEDPVLAGGQTELDQLGLPRPRSGMFASVYKVHGGDHDWAVRCFLQSKPDLIQRYVQIRDTLRGGGTSFPWVVPFDLQQEGIRVAGGRYPILKMRWCQGDALNYWLARNLRNKPALEAFLENWRKTLRSLGGAGIAHGDLQHGNILIDGDQIKLVDYDGIYIPQFSGMLASELGHRSYQHPQRNQSHFGPYLDNFAGWLIYLSVLISGCDRHVWQDFGGGDECLLFRRDDLDHPLESELFHVLEHHSNPQIRESSRTLRYLLSLAPDAVPNLEAPVAVPDDFPALDSIISDLPDWLNLNTNDGSVSAVCPEGRPELPEGKRILRRRRRTNYRALGSGEQSLSGRWLYDENGLSFSPEQANQEQLTTTSTSSGRANSNSQSFQAKILEAQGRPAPYRQIGGKLHSPIFEDSSLVHSRSDRNGCDFEYDTATHLFKVGLAIVTFIVCMALGTVHIGPVIPERAQPPPPPPPQTAVDRGHGEDSQWPAGQFYRLLEGRQAMEAGDLASAKVLLADAVARLKTIPGARAAMNIAFSQDNLGKIHFREGKYAEAKQDFESALASWTQSGETNEYIDDYASVLVEAAQTEAKLGKIASAEGMYAEAIAFYQRHGVLPYYEPMHQAIKEYIELLKRDGKNAEIARVSGLLPEELRIKPQPKTAAHHQPLARKLAQRSPARIVPRSKRRTAADKAP